MTAQAALAVRAPFDAPGLFAFLAARAVHGVETADLGDPDRLVYARTLALQQGPGAVRLTARRTGPADWEMAVQLEGAAARQRTDVLAALGRLLDAPTDSAAIDAALARDPALAPRVARTPGLRVPGAVDPAELVIRAIIGQQISVKAARTHLGRLAQQLGVPYASGFPRLTRPFPTPAAIAGRIPVPPPGATLDPNRVLRLPRRSTATLVAACAALDSGRLQPHHNADPDTLRESLLAIPGIGPWTASYLAMRVLGEPDAWLRGDVALLAGARRLGLLEPGLSTAASHRVLQAHAARWAPWRSYACLHLWQAAAERID